MKKIVLTSVFSLSFCLISLAGTTKIIKANHKNMDQEVKKAQPKNEKYDFSLFKFIAPEKQNIKADSIKSNTDFLKVPKKDEEVILRYEKARAFLMFS
jgi:hypothetical protein